MFDKMREIMTEYNDTVKGTCAVCMDNLCSSHEEEENSNFTERFDLVRIDECFHRFHLLCVHRYWFMPRVSDKDQFGGVVDYNVPNDKTCPICRK